MPCLNPIDYTVTHVICLRSPSNRACQLTTLPLGLASGLPQIRQNYCAPTTHRLVICIWGRRGADRQLPRVRSYTTRKRSPAARSPATYALLNGGIASADALRRGRRYPPISFIFVFR